MGANQSSDSEIAGSSMGYQVLRVYPNSPGSAAGLKAYFDFIIAIGNTRFNKENGSLREILKASIDQRLKMIIFNTRTKSVREVEIIPSTSWGGNGLLGVSIKHSSFDKADERVWHVVDVETGSPAHQAGFKAGQDYVIGSDSILQENDDLYNLIEAHDGKALKLFVYNVNSDNCREVICHPNSKWGGKGFLGCEFGHGLLHRIPYGMVESGDISDSLSAPLLKNEQIQPSAPKQPQANLAQSKQSIQHSQQTPLPSPQTFAQLANALYQNPQPKHQVRSLSPAKSLPEQASKAKNEPHIQSSPKQLQHGQGFEWQSQQIPTSSPQKPERVEDNSYQNPHYQASSPPEPQYQQQQQQQIRYMPPPTQTILDQTSSLKNGQPAQPSLPNPAEAAYLWQSLQQSQQTAMHSTQTSAQPANIFYQNPHYQQQQIRYMSPAQQLPDQSALMKNEQLFQFAPPNQTLPIQAYQWQLPQQTLQQSQLTSPPPPPPQKPEQVTDNLYQNQQYDSPPLPDAQYQQQVRYMPPPTQPLPEQ